MSETTEYDCIVVGAGYSGLAAATRIRDAGKSVLLLEARDDVGGRARSIPSPDGSYFDVGGSFLGDGHDAMTGMARDFGLQTYPVPQDGKIVYLRKGKAKPYTGIIPPLNPIALLDLGITLHRVDKLCEIANVEEPWKTKGAAELDKITLAQYVRKVCWTKEGRDTTDMAMQSILGTGLGSVSLLHALVFFKSNRNTTYMYATKGGAQESFVVGGGQAIAKELHARLGAETVRLSEPVTNVSYSSDDDVQVTTTKGTYKGKKVIIAAPPLHQVKMAFDPPLPTQKSLLLHNMPMGAYMKVFARYKKRWWHDKGFRGESTNPYGFACVVFDPTHEGTVPPTLMGFIVGTKAREFISFSPEKRQRIVLGEFAALFGDEALHPESFFFHTMMEDPWIGGCPLAHPAPGMWTAFGEWMRRPIGPVHWAGTETSTHYMGYMEGAVLSGRRAAEEVLTALK